jgi:hypothetical protein
VVLATFNRLGRLADVRHRAPAGSRREVGV